MGEFRGGGGTVEVTRLILEHVRSDHPMVRRSEEIEREKLVCVKDWTRHDYPEWYISPTVLDERNLKDGKLHGAQKMWYKNGMLSTELNYKDGKLHGTTKGWYEDGTPRIEHEYRDGKRYGVRTEWSADGTLEFQTWWIDGKPHFSDGSPMISCKK